MYNQKAQRQLAPVSMNDAIIGNVRRHDCRASPCVDLAGVLVKVEHLLDPEQSARLSDSTEEAIQNACSKVRLIRVCGPCPDSGYRGYRVEKKQDG